MKFIFISCFDVVWIIKFTRDVLHVKNVHPMMLIAWQCCAHWSAATLRIRQPIEAVVETSWNVMTHAKKPDFVFRRNGRVRLNYRGTSVQSATGNRGVHISGSNAGYTMFRGSVKGTGYPLHPPVSPSLPLSCVTVFHNISTGVYWVAFDRPSYGAMS